MIFTALKISIFITLLIIGIFIFFGYIYSVIEKRNTRYIFSTFGNLGILFTGIIGTSIHEIGHLIMCLIFNHKVINFQLFNFKGYKYESTLGYVSHKYNKNSLYQRAGNFFIGIGPIISGTLFMMLSFKLLMPEKFTLLDINYFLLYMNNINIETFTLLLINLFKVVFSALFSIHNLGNIKFYIFVYLMISISTHISLSKKDFENSSIGIFSLFIILFLSSLICVTFNLNNFLSIFINYLLYLFIFLSIGLIFALISLGIVYIVYSIR
ncbi:hypothetical protein [Terrisporobacter sp.]